MKPIRLALALALAMTAGAALAKLPPLSEDQKLKAEEAKQKAAHNDKVDAYKLCLSQDRVAARTRAAGKGGTPVATPACKDPGPFQFVPPAAVAAKK